MDHSIYPVFGSFKRKLYGFGKSWPTQQIQMKQNHPTDARFTQTPPEVDYGLSSTGGFE